MTARRRAFFLSSVAIVLASVLPAAALNAGTSVPTYRVEVLGPSLQGFDINQTGDVVGRKLLPGQIGRAFVRKAGGAVEVLPVPAEWVSSDAYAISDSGLIVGAVSTVTIASVGSHAAAWYPSREGYEFVLLGALPGDQHSTALGVNIHGDIVGGSGGLGLGLYPNSVQFTLDGPILLPGISLAADVNNERIVMAGNSLLDLETGDIETIPLPPGNWQGFAGNDLNNVGGVCGWVTGFSGCSTFPLRYMPEAGWEFVGGCSTTTAAVSLNDHGDAIAFVYQTGSWVNFYGEGNFGFGDLIAPDQGSWLITGASAINNARQILASGKNLPSNVTELVLLIPIVFGDLDGDGQVGGADLGLLLASWGAFGGDADLDGSGTVDGADLGLLIGAWTG